MSTDISISFKIPGYTFKLLEIVRNQNRMVQFELDKKTRELMIIADLLDFPEHADDWESAEIQKYIERVE